MFYIINFFIALDFLLEALLSEMSKVKSDGASYESWMLGLTEFCGGLLRKYSQMGLKAIIQYIINLLKDNQYHDLVLFSDLIFKMSGIGKLDPVGISDSQVASLGGGDFMRVESVFDSGETRQLRRSATRLASTLVDNGLAIPIAVLIGQAKQECIFNVKDTENLKLLANQLDQVLSFLHIYGNRLPSFRFLMLNMLF